MFINGKDLENSYQAVTFGQFLMLIYKTSPCLKYIL